jgi:AraC-like DNA-binding protein
MNSQIYHIQSKILQPYIKYILFNKYTKADINKKIVSFANNNFCLGIIKNGALVDTKNGTFEIHKSIHTNAYLTGIYLAPFSIVAKDSFEEICIDFTPLGYSLFFTTPGKKYLLDSHILQYIFREYESIFIDSLFEENSIMAIGKLIETILELKYKKSSKELPLLNTFLHFIKSANTNISIQQIAIKMNCSERTIERYLKDNLDVTPKEYLRVARFRKFLPYVGNTIFKQSHHANELGFFDNSHLINEIKFFTGLPPSKLAQQMLILEDTVWFGIY